MLSTDFYNYIHTMMFEFVTKYEILLPEFFYVNKI